MKLKEIYELAVEMGIESDPRGKEQVLKALEKEKKRYEKLSEKEKEEYDLEKLTNPYSDTRVYLGDFEQEVNTVLVGIDMEIGEVLLADRLTEKGTKIDLIITHHPEGQGIAKLYEVMHLQEDILHQLGVPINVAEGIMAPRIGEVKRGLMPLNHNRAIDAARLLGYAFMSVHTPADNLVTTYLTNYFAEKNPETVGEIVDFLKELPEYKEATKIGAGPTIVVGAPERRCGKIFVDMTGGTSGSDEMFSKLSTTEVGTIVTMHLSEKHKKEAEKHNINVVIAGHMASDSLGMNLWLDRLEGKGVKVVATSGLIRVKR
ncbi:NGG1p interacting factor NIF3 [Carboxydothermus pertinax]|uniref:NGG1p interacting factor NIF3 n=1 Tax=Carboxydothermus pertinax TaxID=870242 RepID=A0A1L8CUW4_9THEO|nr:NGG1p interacting factor NIF3 [Carboxydothermus pertinax]GAV22639.1 hypothetical protein cpu_11490 [Carboxydothermus pertinax]